MKRLIFLLSAALLGGLTVLALGQWQTQPQIDGRVGPLYPVNPSYNFRSDQNYDPYQFNWASGRWDYVPLAGGGGSSAQPRGYNPPPYRPYWDEGGPYVFGAPMTMNPSPPAPSPQSDTSPINPPGPMPDDSELWAIPTTQPQKTVEPKMVKFEGRIVAIKAVKLMGETTPHLLLRLVNRTGATGTIDAGQRLAFPDAAFDPAVKGNVTVSGQLGVLDGHLLLFADQIAFGSQTVAIERRGRTPSQ
jgi:hypothetical protein